MWHIQYGTQKYKHPCIHSFINNENVYGCIVNNKISVIIALNKKRNRESEDGCRNNKITHIQKVWYES